jgi:hypothetical protein
MARSLLSLDNMRQVLPALLVGLCAGSAVYAEDVWFWGTKVQPPASVTRDAGPCGEIVGLKTNVVPTKPWLMADTIRQLNSSGDVVRRWRVPIDHYPVGLDGDSVVLAYGSEPGSTLRVDTKGRIKRVPGAPKVYPKNASCPSRKGSVSCVVVSEKPLVYLEYTPVCT